MNTRRENRLEELGRVDAEKAYTSKGKKNLSEEKSRIRKELKWGSTPYDPRRPETIDPQRRRTEINKDGAREITDPQRKKDLRRKLKPLPTPPSRKLSPTDKEHMRRLLKEKMEKKSSRITEGERRRKLSTMEKKLLLKGVNPYLLRTGRPKLATKGWK